MKPVVLCIMDGFGDGKKYDGNAIIAAEPKRLDEIFSNNPTTLIEASGMAVGLPAGQMGNSEVGHTNIGAGRVVYQELTRITKSIKDGDFFENPVLCAACDNAAKTDKAVHLIGLLSDGGVHSHNTHLYALVEMAKKRGVDKIFIHALMDGRDVSPTSGAEFLRELQEFLDKTGGSIATVMGRYYAMDRDNRWERVEKGYRAMVLGEGESAESAEKAALDSYANDTTDEFILPVVLDKNGMISGGDSVIFFNFRPDRAREITRTFVDADFDGFERPNGFFPLNYVCMTQYDATMPNVEVAFKPVSLDNTLGEYLSQLGKKQLRIAETEKYAHVTFFFNGGVEKEYEGEDRVLIPSPKVATYDLQPEMSAYEVAENCVECIKSGKYDVIIMNYANCDMVGHTGVFEAAVKAVKAVNECVGMTVDAVKEVGGVMLLTADHGNADKMLEEDGAVFTAHTTNPVPFSVIGLDNKLRSGGCLADIAPTILDIMGIEQPKEMTGTSLLLTNG